MTIENKGNYKILRPSEGMWLYDGDTVSDSVYLPVGADVSRWREITDAERVEIESQVPQPEEPTYEEPIAEPVSKDAIIELAKQYKADYCKVVVNGTPIFIEPSERANYKAAIDAAMLLGKGSETVSIFGVTITWETAQRLLAQFELFCAQCTFVLNGHIDAINALEDAGEYDYTTGYPERIVVNN